LGECPVEPLIAGLAGFPLHADRERVIGCFHRLDDSVWCPGGGGEARAAPPDRSTEEDAQTKPAVLRAGNHLSAPPLASEPRGACQVGKANTAAAIGVLTCRGLAIMR
jgi:hypothetical protein